MTLLLRTQIGSHLYGLAHADSDMDYYEVYSERRKTRQSIVDGVDTIRIGLDKYMQYLNTSHQAIEALFSPVKEVNELQWLVDAYVPGVETYKMYRRTIRNFWAAGEFKKQRHAARLYLNLTDLYAHGRFNPRLNEHDREFVEQYALYGLDCPRF